MSVESGRVDRVNERLIDARRQLLNLPGVAGVGFGYKERAGVATDELSLRVYVREKKPATALDAAAVVPKEVNGLQTDVVLPLKMKNVLCEDTAHHGTMVGGIRVSNLRRFHADDADDLRYASGTLGCIVTLNDVSGRDNVGFISCNHVLADSGGANGHTIYQPDVSASNPSSGHYHPIGRIHNVGVQRMHTYRYPEEPERDARPFFLDCATARINTKFSSWCDTNCGVKFDTRIRTLDLGGSSAVAGIARVSADDLVGTSPGNRYLLYKVGTVTGRTIGHAHEIEGTGIAEDGTEVTGILVMRYSGPNCDEVLVTGTDGDSGSVVLNEDRNVVGVLFAVDQMLGATAFVSHIHPALEVLNATIRTTGSGPVASGGGTLAVNDVRILPPTPTRERARELRERILFSRHGKDLYRLVDAHREEVLHLVNKSRPVTVTWHRNRGPDFLAHIAEAARDTAKSVPRALHGVGLPDALDRVLTILGTHGSSALRQDVEAHREHLATLVREVDDIEQLAERFVPERHAKPGSAAE